MKLMYGNVPVKSLNINYFEQDTNDCTMVASDLQAGITAVARGQKITGTGKSFEFAYYGAVKTNQAQYIPNNINVVEIASLDYPIRHAIALTDMENIDFSTQQIVGYVTVDGMEYDVKVQAVNNFLTLSCEKTIFLEIFYGKDNYA